MEGFFIEACLVVGSKQLLSLLHFYNQKFEILRVLHIPDNGMICRLGLKTHLPYFSSCILRRHINDLKKKVRLYKIGAR